MIFPMKTLFQQYSGGTVLFLGRMTQLTPQEIAVFLEEQGMHYSDRYEGEEVALLVLSSMLSPEEEQLSYRLYEAGVPDVSLEHFLQYYSSQIQPNSLLMSLKLSNDQMRLRRMLANDALDEALFLKLMMLYDWGGDGVMESDANRDVTVSFIKRFFRPESFRDPAMIYAPTTLMIIAGQSRDPMVLATLLTMPNHQVKTSRYEQRKPANLREAVAFNTAVDRPTVRKLLAYRDGGIDYFLAANTALDREALWEIYRRSDSAVREMMAHNEALPEELFEALLQREEAVQQALLTHQSLRPSQIERLLAHPLRHYLGANRSVTDALAQLLALEDAQLDSVLAANPVAGPDTQQLLYRRYGTKIAAALAANPSLEASLAMKLFEHALPEVEEALAANSATPPEILDRLCQRESPSLNPHLAANPSVDIYWLRQFQLDTSLIRILAENRTYAAHIMKGLGL